MESLPTSNLRLLDLAGNALDKLPEWTPALIELPPTDWKVASLIRRHIRSEEMLPISMKQVGGQWRVAADWPRSDSGHYQLILSVGRQIITEQIVTVNPSKLSLDAYIWMLEDLDTRLPASIAVGLQRTGALAGLRLLPPGQSTLAQEMTRLRRAVKGSQGRIGLVQILGDLSHEPHQIFEPKEVWVTRQQARRPHPARLAQAMTRPHNLDAIGNPIRVLDTRVQPTFDTYENRLLKAYFHLVHSRLRRIMLVREIVNRDDLLDEVKTLLSELESARRRATFLDEVRLPAYLPTQITMVLLKHPVYRAALEGYVAFKQSPTVRLEEVLLEAPLENIPSLYQVWGTLNVFDSLLKAATDQGYEVKQQRLAEIVPQGVFLQLLRDGNPILELLHPLRGTIVKLIPERTYGSSGILQSFTHKQRPDIAVEIQTSTGHWHVYLFDPKYKLRSDKTDGNSNHTDPVRDDINKMHVYRDAIRDQEGRLVVDYAAILYPGQSKSYPVGIEALRAYPNPESVEELQTKLYNILYVALT